MKTLQTRPEEDEVRAIRALAHPLRLRLLDELQFGGPSTATKLGRVLGESSGATSYHLRLLARYGYVEEEERSGHRERWWRYRERQLRLGVGPGMEEGRRRLLSDLLGREAAALDRFLARAQDLPEWKDAAFLRSSALRLTAAEFDTLRGELMELLDRQRPAEVEDAPSGALPVRFLTFGFPHSAEEH